MDATTNDGAPSQPTVTPSTGAVLEKKDEKKPEGDGIRWGQVSAGAGVGFLLGALIGYGAAVAMSDEDDADESDGEESEKAAA